jgi:hypothetical protein
VLAIFLLVVTCSGLAVAQQCFAPLSNPLSNNKADWKDLVERVPDVSAAEVTRLQTIASGTGDKINLDFYSITVRKHPTKSLSVVFREIRQHFGSFAYNGASGVEGASENFFRPYQYSDSSLRMRNKALWESETPKGAVMSFILASYAPALARTSTLRGIRPVLEQGDVVVTCANATDFIFSTVRTVNGGYHPVSGHRGFGIRDNGDGTWTFYSKGADRETDYLPNNGLKRGARNPPIEGSMFNPNQDAVFQAGHLFWLEFFANVIDYLNPAGMTLTSPFVKNSKRYTYPL